jgi:hypothetical protein
MGSLLGIDLKFTYSKIRLKAKYCFSFATIEMTERVRKLQVIVTHEIILFISMNEYK